MARFGVWQYTHGVLFLARFSPVIVFCHCPHSEQVSTVAASETMWHAASRQTCCKQRWTLNVINLQTEISWQRLWRSTFSRSYLLKFAHFYPNPPTFGASLAGDPIWVLPRSSAWENLSPWTIVWHCLHDPIFSHFSRTSACDRQTDMTTAYTVLAWCRMVKTTTIVRYLSKFGTLGRLLYQPLFTIQSQIWHVRVHLQCSLSCRIATQCMLLYITIYKHTNLIDFGSFGALVPSPVRWLGPMIFAYVPNVICISLILPHFQLQHSVMEPP